jgi:hypothetical protein
MGPANRITASRPFSLPFPPEEEVPRSWYALRQAAGIIKMKKWPTGSAREVREKVLNK